MSVEPEIKLKALEEEVAAMKSEIEALKNGSFEGDENLEKLMIENMKLKHRLAILNKAIENEKRNSSSSSPANELILILDHLHTLFQEAIQKSFPNVEVPAVIKNITNPKFGDYQFNSAMNISQLLKSRGINQSPRDIANKIFVNVGKSSVISKIEVAGAGFINIFLEKEYAKKAISLILKDGVNPPTVDKKRIIVDFSSPNIAKEMHVGHLRSTIIGDAICRLLEFLGHDVLRINHVGDWGTQFGMLISHLEDRFPNFKKESPPISDLQAFYKESKVRFDSDEEFKKRAYQSVVKLQKGDPDSRKAWNLICDVSRKEFQQIYDQLDVKIVERGESFYNDRMRVIVAYLEKNGFLEEDEGRKIMWGIKGEDFGGIPLTVVKSDGGFTYDTSDMATIQQRLEEEKADWIIYVTDSGQSSHFKAIFSCAKRANIFNESKHRVDHVGFGVVLGEDGKKFKTRSGDTVKLSDLLNEGLKRSMDKLIEKGRDKILTANELKQAQENVAFGCIKYADLSKNRTNEYVFSFDKMLEDRGNTAVYLLYAYTRIKSIARNLGEDFIKNLPKIIQDTPIELDHEKEWKLAKVLIQFPDIIIRITKELQVHFLCEYLYEISTTFTEFYDNCYCIEKNKDGSIKKINHSRILLCEATSLVMLKCFEILGLKPLQKI